MQAPNAEFTHSEPTPHCLQLNEFMSLLSGCSLDNIIGAADSSERAHAIRNMQRMMGLQPRYLCDEPERQLFEIIYLKLSVLLRMISLMRETQLLLSTPLSIETTQISADILRPTGVSPAFWNYRLMITPLPINNDLGMEMRKQKEAYFHDARALGLIMIESLLTNKRIAAEQIRAHFLHVCEQLKQQATANPASLNDAREGLLAEQIRHRLFGIHNVFYDKACEIRSQHINSWNRLLVAIFKLTTQIPGFSYFHHLANSSSNGIVDALSDFQQFQTEFKLKMFEPVYTDKKVALLLREML